MIGGFCRSRPPLLGVGGWVSRGLRETAEICEHGEYITFLLLRSVAWDFTV